MINWDLWNQAGQKLQNETRDLYDFSWVTPEVVKGFTRYQALRPETEIKEADEYKTTRDAITDDDVLELFKYKKAYGPKLNEYLENKDYLNKGYLKPGVNNVPAGEMSVGTRPMTGGNASLEVAARPDEIREKEFEKEFMDTKWANVSQADKEALKEELLKERLGKKYNTMKRSYDIYGKLNPYQRMIEAGKRSSYWDPEIGKIFTDSADKMHNESVKAWEQTRRTAEGRRDYALNKAKMMDGNPSYLAEADYWQNQLTELDTKSPNLTGAYFEGLTPEQLERYSTNREPSNNEQNLWALVRNGKIDRYDPNGNLLYYEDGTVARKTLSEEDLRNDPTFKSMSPETQAYWLMQLRAQNEKREQQQTARDEAVMRKASAIDKAKYDEWNKIRESLAKADRLNFTPEKGYDNDGSPIYSENQAIDAIVYLDSKGISVEKMFEKNPEFRRLRSQIYNDNGKLKLGLAKNVALMTLFTQLKRENVLEANKGRIMNLAKREYDADMKQERTFGDALRDGLDNAGYDYSNTVFDKRRFEKPRPRVASAEAETTTQVAEPAAQVVDVESLDWTGAPYQTASLKKELKNALNGKESKFKKQGDGTYLWVGGTRIQTYDPATGKVTQVMRNPGRRGAKTKDAEKGADLASKLKNMLGKKKK